MNLNKSKNELNNHVADQDRIIRENNENSFLNNARGSGP